MSGDGVSRFSPHTLESNSLKKKKASSWLSFPPDGFRAAEGPLSLPRAAPCTFVTEAVTVCVCCSPTHRTSHRCKLHPPPATPDSRLYPRKLSLPLGRPRAWKPRGPGQPEMRCHPGLCQRGKNSHRLEQEGREEYPGSHAHARWLLPGHIF